MKAEIKFTRKKLNIQVVNRRKRTLEPLEVVSVLIDDHQFYYNRESKNLMLTNGVVVFPYIGNKSDVVKRLEGFTNPDSFWDVVKHERNNQTPEQLLEYEIKFGTSDVQDEIIRTLGLKPYQAYCAYSYAQGFYKLDVIGIDDILKERYPDKYKDDMSMEQFLTEVFDEEFAELFKQYI